MIAFRDRGTDPRRLLNFRHVLRYVAGLGLGEVYVVDDQRSGAAQFNRHAAYNYGTRLAFSDGAEVITYYEADMLVPRQQLVEAIAAALEEPRLVIPFDERHEYDGEQSDLIMTGVDPATLTAPVVKYAPRRIGAVNVLSRDAIEAVGQWDEQFEGNWWDDRSMGLAFRVCTRHSEKWIPGRSTHLWHLPGYKGQHLTPEDRAATARNEARFRRYETAETPEQIRALTMEGGGCQW